MRKWFAFMENVFHLKIIIIKKRKLFWYFKNKRHFFEIPSRLFHFGLSQYLNSPLMFLLNTHTDSYSASSWGETSLEFMLDEILWTDSENQCCAPAWKTFCQAACMQEDTGDFKFPWDIIAKESGTMSCVITKCLDSAKWYKEIQFGLTENFSI